MADLHVGATVEFIKDPPNASIGMIGYKGKVVDRVSGGWRITTKIGMYGDYSAVVGSMDWQEYVKIVVDRIAFPISSPLPKSLESWYNHVQKVLKQKD